MYSEELLKLSDQELIAYIKKGLEEQSYIPAFAWTRLDMVKDRRSVNEMLAQFADLDG